MNALPNDVTIIGAGLAGTALALALYQQGIRCRIFESRNLDAPELASGVVLTPNGLRILDALGVFSRITDHCWKSEYRTYKNDRDETTRKVLITNEELYGYKNHRIWRRLLLEEVKLMLQERNIEITYGSNFNGIISEDKDGVAFNMNGKAERAAMLVGADGIFSSVRNYLEPNVKPEYTGTVGALAHIRRDTVVWPYPDYEPACTIQGKPGAFFIMPEDPEAKDIMVGTQVQRTEQTRAEWDELAADKEQLCDFFRKGYNDWHDTAQQIIDQVSAAKDSIYLWPFLRMPRIRRWYSETGKVVILGDAAHAIPPSSGQGVNQALEDVYSLVLVLVGNADLQLWQSMRQKRVNTVFDWATNATNVQRLPQAERDKLLADGKIQMSDANNGDEMRWLYQTDIAAEVAAVLSQSQTI